MDELIRRITASTGLDVVTAEKAVGMILAFLQKEGPQAEVAELQASMPGAKALADQHAGGGGGGLMGGLAGMMGGGGVMALGGQLMGAGLSMDQIQTIGRELFAFGRETAGEDKMGRIVGAIPGLSQFV